MGTHTFTHYLVCLLYFTVSQLLQLESFIVLVSSQIFDRKLQHILYTQ